MATKKFQWKEWVIYQQTHPIENVVDKNIFVNSLLIRSMHEYKIKNCPIPFDSVAHLHEFLDFPDFYFKLRYFI